MKVRQIELSNYRKYRKKEVLLSLPMWEGDKIFLKRLEESKDFFTLKLRYEGDELVESKMWEY